MKEETFLSSINNPLALLLASLAYSHIFIARITKPILRVISLVPVFYIFTILPWYFSSSFLRGLVSFFITWITSFKLLLFCFKKGPVFDCKNYFDFVLVSIFPIKFKGTNQHLDPFLAPKLGFLLPILTYSCIYRDLYEYKPFSGVSIMILGFYSLWTCGPGLARVVSRYELVPLFNHPYLATSLHDFWGRRWNRLSSSILRHTIHDPTKNALLGIVGVGPAKVVALITTLVVSGIMHELMFYYITCGLTPSWEMTWFFVLHGLCMAFESIFKYLARARGWSPVHSAISRLLTLGFVLATFYRLLVLPVLRSAQNDCNLLDKGLRS
ncbi:hypothetical protein K2173_017994 [Erythroxylum novogranatense]|uniref:Wax synthase domain-containing protein n=1 Tax=Erythroxylum novogranatense TaxID=1862640 RepID=A0AAV8TUN6_9ROSI|nr:hypothetical protein K2173_017994 [Erythroxylum novogranatense]